MNKLLLILGLTILYYAILIYWDNKKRKAFKIAQKQVIGETTPLPIIEKEERTTELFGATNMETINPIRQQPSPIKTEALFEKLALADNHLEQDLEELALDLATEQAIETPKEIQDLATTNNDDLKEDSLANVVTKISNRK